MSRYASSSLRNIIEKEMDGDLYLPVFQRGFKWARKKQKSLLSSFLVDIPIGAVLFLDGDGDEFAKRRLCFRDENRVVEATDCKYLLDGQQRISTLKSMFYDFFGDPEAWEMFMTPYTLPSKTDGTYA